MQTSNSHYFSNCKFIYKLLLLLTCGIPTACSKENQPKPNIVTETPSSSVEFAVNINSASVEELEKLPHIGEKTAREIVEYREKFGKFRKPEHLLLIRGFSDKKFREIRNLIVAE